jgi:hypothetical protein
LSVVHDPWLQSFQCRRAIRAIRQLKVGITKHCPHNATGSSVVKASELPAGIASDNPKRTSFETALNLPMIGKPMAQRCSEFSRISSFRQKWPKFAAGDSCFNSIS